MGAPKGHKKVGGRQKGVPNKKTAQWEAFSQYCMEGGLERFQKEMNALKGKDYVNTFVSLLEFHKPKLQRTTLEGSETAPIILNVITEQRNKGK